jgi:hypothetical protein
MVVIHAGTHSEHVQVIRGDFKPGSVERSRSRQGGYTPL